jgi:putative N6-adenine-specific DNA methylase
MVEAARARIEPVTPAPIYGSDRDAGAIDAARANAVRAGVDGDIDFEVDAYSNLTPPADQGWVVTNPPYGVRVGERRRLRDLYAAIGNVARERLEGWTFAMLSADPELQRQTGIDWREAAHTTNGGIPVKLLVGSVTRLAGPAPAGR